MLRSPWRLVAAFGVSIIPAACASNQLCVNCHPKEVAGYARSGMARSLALAGAQPDGAFEQSSSGATFRSFHKENQVWQSATHGTESQQLPALYAIGSGNHAVGYLVSIGNHLFQSPMSYYTSRRAWDLAPGYEQSPAPDFSRPVTVECLTCHSEKPQPVPGTLNSYRSPPFAGMAIECDRCHGSTAAHLRNPVPGSILNPAKLAPAARDSVCEQCHLAGEIRVPNPGKAVSEYQPGQPLESIYTVYVSSQPANSPLKVISHSEQLRLSACARSSGDRLWCGTCHNPHDKPVDAVAYYRERCLSCHAGTLPAAHAGPNRDCIGCHMPKRGARDGGHTAFTDHRISRHPGAEVSPSPALGLTAWRDPAPELRDRNLAIALATSGLEDSLPDRVIRGYKMLNRMQQPALWNDAPALTVLGNILLVAKQPAEASRRFERALVLRPDYPPYQVNLAGALLAQGDIAKAQVYAEHAVELDPLLAQAVHLLNNIYRVQNEPAKADALLNRYRTSIGIKSVGKP